MMDGPLIFLYADFIKRPQALFHENELKTSETNLNLQALSSLENIPPLKLRTLSQEEPSPPSKENNAEGFCQNRRIRRNG